MQHWQTMCGFNHIVSRHRSNSFMWPTRFYMHFICLFLYSIATNNCTRQTSEHPTSALTQTIEFGEAGLTRKAKDLIKEMTAVKLLCTGTLCFQGCSDSSALPSISHALWMSQLLLLWTTCRFQPPSAACYIFCILSFSHTFPWHLPEPVCHTW